MSRPTLLLLDENDDVRKLLCRVLEGSDYTVLEAADAEAAVALARAHPGAIDLFLIDPTFHRVNSVDVACQLSAIRPGAKALYISGYPAEVLLDRNLWRPGLPLLHKPFLPQTLLQTVRALLADR